MIILAQGKGGVGGGDDGMEIKNANKTPITLEDLAQKTGLSPSTVSRALNNHASVSLTTRKRVYKIAQELGYRRATDANNIGEETVAICVPFPEEYGLRNPYFAEIIRGAYTVFHRLNHWHVMVEDIQRLFDIRTLVRGLIAVSLDDAALTFADPLDFPMVVVDSAGPAASIAVTADNVRGMAMATEHVVLLGHRAIAYVGPVKTQTARDRLQGFQQALALHHLDPVQIVTTVGSSFEEGYQACANLWRQPQTPTAVMAFNDYMALGALTFLQSRGIRVPDDVSVVGYDGIGQLPLYGLTKLTTIDQHAFEQGYTAANLLLSLVSGHRPGTTTVQIAPHLLIGGTTAHSHNVRVSLDSP